MASSSVRLWHVFECMSSGLEGAPPPLVPGARPLSRLRESGEPSLHPYTLLTLAQSTFPMFDTCHSSSPFLHTPIYSLPLPPGMLPGHEPHDWAQIPRTYLYPYSPPSLSSPPSLPPFIPSFSDGINFTFIKVAFLPTPLSLSPFSLPQPKYISEAGAVVLVGLIISLIVRLASHGEAKEWLRGIRYVSL